MDIAAIKTRLAALEVTITGIVAAYAQTPASIVDLPCVLNYAGSAQYSRVALGQDADFEVRDMIVRVLVARIQQGIPGEAEGLVEAFIDRVRAFFDARPGLMLSPVDNVVMRAGLVSDTGIARFAVAGEEFVGVEFRLQVQQHSTITFADYE